MQMTQASGQGRDLHNRSVKRFLNISRFVAVIPEFGRDEDFFSGNTTFFDCASDCGLGAVT